MAFDGPQATGVAKWATIGAIIVFVTVPVWAVVIGKTPIVNGGVLGGTTLLGPSGDDFDVIRWCLR